MSWAIFPKTIENREAPRILGVAGVRYSEPRFVSFAMIAEPGFRSTGDPCHPSKSPCKPQKIQGHPENTSSECDGWHATPRRSKAGFDSRRGH